jgi:ribonuclease HII
MHTINEIVEEAKRLTASDRRRLVAEIQKGLASEEVNEAQAQRLAALNAWIAKAGTGQSTFTDVARDKYKHLAEVYADRHE